jgi:hypothetical protein
MLIYRVETETGLGPWADANGTFQKGAGTLWCENAVSLHYAARRLLDETKHHTKWRFGFVGLPQLLHYMRSFNELAVTEGDRSRLLRQFERMRDCKLKVSVYRVNQWRETAIGDASQCIFQLDQAELVTRLDPCGRFIHDYVRNYGAEIAAMLTSDS